MNFKNHIKNPRIHQITELTSEELRNFLGYCNGHFMRIIEKLKKESAESIGISYLYKNPE